MFEFLFIAGMALAIQQLRKHVKLNLYVAYVLMGIGMLFLLLGIYFHQQQKNVATSFIQTTCTVTDLQRDIKEPIYASKHSQPPPDLSLCPQAKIQHEVQGKQYTGFVNLGCVLGMSAETSLMNGHPIGQTLNCWYDPSDMSRITLNLVNLQNIYSSSSYLFFILGLFLLVWTVQHLLLPPKPIDPLPMTVPLQTSTVPQTNLAQTPKDQDPLIKNPHIMRGFVLCVAAILLFFGIWILRIEWRAKHSYTETSCTILNKRMESHATSNRTAYSSYFLLKYSVNNQSYTVWHTPNILNESTNSYSLARSTLDYYQLNKSYPCWYDPTSPTRVILEQGYTSGAILLTFFGCVLLYAGLSPWKKYPYKYVDGKWQ